MESISNRVKSYLTLRSAIEHELEDIEKLHNFLLTDDYLQRFYKNIEDKDEAKRYFYKMKTEVAIDLAKKKHDTYIPLLVKYYYGSSGGYEKKTPDERLKDVITSNGNIGEFFKIIEKNIGKEKENILFSTKTAMYKIVLALKRYNNLDYYIPIKYSRCGFVDFFEEDNKKNKSSKPSEIFRLLSSENVKITDLKNVISQGIDINEEDLYGDTPIMQTVYINRFDVLKMLKEHGANINHMTNDGRTVASIAAIEGKYDMLEYLLENGANINNIISNKHRKLTALDSVNSQLKGLKSTLNSAPRGISIKGTKIRYELYNDIKTLLIKYGAKTAAELEAERKSRADGSGSR